MLNFLHLSRSGRKGVAASSNHPFIFQRIVITKKRESLIKLAQQYKKYMTMSIPMLNSIYCYAYCDLTKCVTLSNV